MVSKRPIIGLTGMACTGKSMVLKMLWNMGFHTIEADKLGHEVMTYPRVVERIMTKFGCVNAKGEIMRRELGRIVFADPHKLWELENIIHGDVQNLVEQQIELTPEDTGIVIESACLRDSPIEPLCTSVLMMHVVDNAWREGQAALRGWSRDELARRDEAFLRRLGNPPDTWGIMVNDPNEGPGHLVSQVNEYDKSLGWGAVPRIPPYA